MNKTIRPLILAALALCAADAFAGSASVPFTVTGTVVANCTLTVTGPSFTYDPVSANAATNAPATGGSMVVTCTKGSAPSIALDNGSNNGLGPSGAAHRAMKQGSGATATYLSYDLYWPGTTTGWTTASPFVPTSPTSKAPRTFNIDGAALAGQDVGVGTYTDTVNATINF
jgi:spore coat protein U-like protein